MSEFLLFWMILFSLGRGGVCAFNLVSWIRASGFFRLIQDSFRSAFEYQVVGAGEYCSNPVLKPEQSSVTDLYFYQSRFLSHHLTWRIPGDCQFI